MSHTGCFGGPASLPLPPQLLKVSGREALPPHLAEGTPPVSPLRSRLSVGLCTRLLSASLAESQLWGRRDLAC